MNAVTLATRVETEYILAFQIKTLIRLNMHCPADSMNRSAERIFGAIPNANLRAQNQRPSLNYFTKVLLVLFPKTNSNLRPSRRPPTQILPTVGAITSSIKIADF